MKRRDKSPLDKREVMSEIATGATPWFFTLSLAAFYAAALACFPMKPLAPLAALEQCVAFSSGGATYSSQVA